MIRRTLAALAALTLCSHSFALGGKEADPRRASAAAIELPALEIRVGALKGPTGIGMIQLFETPAVLPDNTTMRTEAVASADGMAAKMLSSEIDVAVLPVNMAAKLYNSGVPYRLLAVVGTGMIKIVAVDETLKAPADLKGRDVYIAGQGATPDLLFRTVLPSRGLSPETDVRMVFSMAAPEIAASLVAGRVSVGVLPEPFATMALKGNPAARVPFSLSALWTEATGQPDYPISVVVARASLIQERPAAVAAFMKAYEASIAATLADPVASGRLVEKHDLGLKAPVATAAIPVCAFTFIPAPEARSSIEALLSVFLKAAPASVGGRLPDEAFYAALPR